MPTAQSNQQRRLRCEIPNRLARLVIRRFLAIVPIAFCLHSAGAGDFSWPVGLRGTSVSFGGSGQDYYHTETDETYPRADHNPDAEEKSRLVVEWGPASMGYVDNGDFEQKGDQYWRTWKDDKLLRPDRELSIRGRVLSESPDRKARPKSPKPKPIPSRNTFDDAVWDARLKAAAKLNIHWDQAEQKYILK
jgi:hypothetical protein